MKKKIVSGILVLFLSLNSLFAAGNKDVSAEVKASFNKEFVNAEHVQWDSFDELVRATFLLNNQSLSAFYHSDGELVALTRNISPEQLPAHLLIQLKANYMQYWISELVEIYIDGGTQYYATLDNGETILTVKSNSGEYWQTERKKRNKIFHNNLKK